MLRMNQADKVVYGHLSLKGHLYKTETLYDGHHGYLRRTTGTETVNRHLRLALCSEKIPQNGNIGALHDTKLQYFECFVVFLQFAECILLRY